MAKLHRLTAPRLPSSAGAAAHYRDAPSFPFDFACVCLISLMRARRADRVGGNAPFVSFAS